MTTERPKVRPMGEPIESGVKGKMGMEGINGKIVLIMLLIAAAVSYGMIQFAAVTPTPLKKLTTDIMTTVNGVKDAQTKDADNILGLQNEISGISSIASGARDTVTGFSSRIDQATSKADAASTKVDSQDSKVNSLTSLVTTLQETVNGYKTTIQTQTESISSLNTKLTTNEATIKDLQAKVVALQAGGGGTTPGATGTVTASVVGNVFTGLSTMGFGAIAPAGNQTLSFTYQIDNQTGKNLSAIQLALALQVTDAVGTTVVLPTTAVFAVSSGNLSTVWTAQDTGIGYLKGFITNATTGFASMFGSATVAKGVNTYNVTVTLTNNGVAATPAVYVTPMVKIVNYTAQ